MQIWQVRPDEGRDWGGPATYICCIDFDQKVLKPLGLQPVIKLEPAKVGGVGGEATVIASFEVPIALGGLVGILGVVVVAGSCPWLLPVGLMKALEGRIDLKRDIIEWQVSPCLPNGTYEANSKIVMQPIGSSRGAGGRRT